MNEIHFKLMFQEEIKRKIILSQIKYLAFIFTDNSNSLKEHKFYCNSKFISMN